MKKIKINQIISNFLTFSILFSMFINTVVYATGDAEVDKILIDVAEILLTVAGLACVGKLIQIGIKYMMTAAEEKSNAKMALLPWLIGTIVCFGAAWIGKTVVGIFDNGPTEVLSY